MQRRAADVLKSGRVMSFVAAALIFLAALIESLLFFGVTAGTPPDPLFFEFDRTQRAAAAAAAAVASRVTIATDLEKGWLMRQWDWNLAAFPSLLASDFLLSLGLLAIAYVAWVLTKAYRAAGGLAARIMFLFFALGATVPAVGFLQNLGSTTAGDYIYSAWKEPTNYYQEPDVLVSLQLSFLMSLGRSVWIQALLYVLLGGGFWFCGFLGLIHSSELRSNRLPRTFKWHSLFSFAVGFFGFVVFAADITKFFVNMAYTFYGFVTVIYMVILIPAWTIWLGIILTRIPAEFMKGVVVVTGPAYAELGGDSAVRVDEMSVEMEETAPRSKSEEGDIVDDGDNVVEINLK